jgi:type II secretory pathway pseudopilin PulG
LCPFCGANQAPLPEIVISELEKSRNLTSVFLRWIMVTVAVACSLAGLLWFARREHVKNLEEQEETTASKALHEIRTALSQYALTSGDQYPSSLGTLGDRAAQPLQETRKENYEVTYTPKSSKKDGSITGFELWANPGKPNLRSFFIDESGVLRATRENRPANSEDPPI